MVGFILILTLAGCGGGGGFNPRFAGTPTGSFTNASLSGTYVFSLAGTNIGGFFATAGTFQADGNGNITSGVQDVNASSGVFTQLPVFGSYRVTADGRGTAVLNSQVATMTLDFVLISSQHGLVIRLDSIATASGTLDRQDAPALSALTLQAPFAFNISGVNAAGRNIQSVGAFTGDAAGNLTGVQDQNNGGTLAINAAVQGSYLLGAGGRAALQLATAAGTLNFAAYIVDANHLKLVETDFVPAMAGDAYRQPGSATNALLTGSYAFTLGGSSTTGPFAAGGIFTADGNGAITTGVEDLNNASVVTTALPLTGTYALAGSRGTLTLRTTKATSNFAIYPSTGGLQMLELDTTVSGGAAFAQQGGTISSSTVQGLYGYNATGADTSGPTDVIAQFTADGNGAINGALDQNLAGSLAQNLALGGGYAITSTGRGTLRLLTSFGPQNFVVYVVSSARVLVLQVDPSTIAVGSFEQQ